jgi:hypothetical protein
MVHVIIISFLLSVIHAAIPSHWLPIVAIGRVEKWNQRTTLLAAGISGIAHVASTIMIGILVGWAGYRLSAVYEWVTSVAAPGVLVGFGLVYIFHNFFTHRHRHHIDEHPPENSPFIKVVVSLSLGMFFSPCIELESYYFTAGTLGWAGIGAVSVVYLLVTVGTMVALVNLAMRGINRYRFSFLDKNEKAVIGAVLVAVGIISYVIHL